MEILGIIFLVLIVLGVLALLAMVVASASDIRRYLRIRQM